MIGKVVMNSATAKTNPFELVVIGASLGGMHALKTLLSSLPVKFSLPLVAVQHRPKDSEASLGKYFSLWTSRPVFEADDKTPLVPGHIYFAPSDYHLMIDDKNLALSTEGPVKYSRPSIDVLFETAAEWYNERAVGIILTGTGSDGPEGARELEERGGLLIVQDPEEAEADILPRSTIAATKHPQIMRLNQIVNMLETINQTALEARTAQRK